MAGGLSEGNKKGLRAVANRSGVIAALAFDQQWAPRELFPKVIQMQADSPPSEELAQFREAVSGLQTPYASAILLDAEYGLPAARQRAKSVGLPLAYEKTGFDQAVASRLPLYLSQGVSNEIFLYALELATEAGVKFSGVLCGCGRRVCRFWSGMAPRRLKIGCRRKE